MVNYIKILLVKTIKVLRTLALLATIFFACCLDSANMKVYILLVIFIILTGIFAIISYFIGE